MGSIQKREGKSGVSYRAQVLIDGKRIGETFPNKKSALAWVHDMEAKKNQGKYIMPTDAKQRTVGQLIDRYIQEYLPQLKSRKDRERELLRWRDLLGDVKLYQLSSDQIIQARNEIIAQTNRYGEPVGNATVNRYHAALNAVLNVAELEYRWIESNPMKYVKKFKEPEGRTRSLTNIEQRRLLNAAKADSSPLIFPLIVTCLLTGMRIGEAVKLKWKNVDFTHNLIIIENPKNGETRSAYLPVVLTDIFNQLYERHGESSEYVFPSKNGLKPASMKSAWNRVVKNSGIEDFRFHDTRHTFATNLAQRGASVPEISAGLGHKSFQMAARYTHLTPAGNKDLVEDMAKNSLVELDDE